MDATITMYYATFLVHLSGACVELGRLRRPPVSALFALLYYTLRLCGLEIVSREGEGEGEDEAEAEGMAVVYEYILGAAFIVSCAAISSRWTGKWKSGGRPAAAGFVSIGVFVMLLSEGFLFRYVPSVWVFIAIAVVTPALVVVEHWMMMSGDNHGIEWKTAFAWAGVAVLVQTVWTEIHVLLHRAFWHTYDSDAGFLSSAWSWVGGALVVFKMLASIAPAVMKRVLSAREL